jgi:RNA polymerase-binding transcription factor DksA
MTGTQSTECVAPVGADRETVRLVRLRLLAERGALLEETARPALENEQQATTGSGETDYINVETERQLVAVLDAYARQALEEVERALARIADGTYGRCIGCGVSINAERLMALPRVGCCIDCRRVEGRRPIPRRT